VNELLSERSEGILRVQFNRPAKKNAMTMALYTGLADLLNEADKDDSVNVVLLSGAGDSFCAGNDLDDFMKNPPGPGDSPQARLINTLIRFSKPLVAAVNGVAIGGGTTILTHLDFVYAAESARFQIPFINLALVPEFGSSFLLPRQIGYLQAAELILLGGTSSGVLQRDARAKRNFHEGVSGDRPNTTGRSHGTANVLGCISDAGV
jgi:enoyl-CoA hydratase/carnithine racemase